MLGCTEPPPPPRNTTCTRRYPRNTQAAGTLDHLPQELEEASARAEKPRDAAFSNPGPPPPSRPPKSSQTRLSAFDIGGNFFGPPEGEFFSCGFVYPQNTQNFVENSKNG